jgi:hypothetical protein
MSVVVDLAYQQRVQALARANVVRAERAELLRAIAEGELDVTMVLADLPECVASMPAYRLLLAVYGIGRTHALFLLGQVPVSTARTLGGMTVRERHVLARLVGGRKWRTR